MKALEILVAGVISATVFLSGCQTRFYEYSSPRQPGSTNVSFLSQSASSIGDISPITKGKYDNNANIDQLIGQSDDFINYLDFRNKYTDYQNQITSNLENNNYNKADQLVRDLAERLERDNNPYSKLYLEKVKNFTYVMRTSYAAIVGEEHGPNEHVGVYTGAILALPAIGLMSAMGDDYAYNLTFGNWIVKKEVIKRIIEDVQVNPYKNQREVIKKQVVDR